MSYQSEVLADSPVCYLRLGESSGSVAADETANNLDGTYTNTPTLGATGIDGAGGDTAITCANASNQHVDIGNDALMPVNVGPFSVEIWFKATSAANGIVTKGESRGAGGNRDFDIYGNGADLFVLLRNTTTIFLNKNCGAFPSLNEWHHLVFTWDGTNDANKAIVYLDGLQLATGTVSAGAIDNDENWHVGGNDASFSFDGELDEFAYYDSVLSADRVRRHFVIGADSLWSDANLALWLRADQSVTKAGGGTPVDNDAIEQWTSLEGNAYDFDQLTGADQPLYKDGANGINNKAVIKFDGGSDYLKRAGSLFSGTSGAIYVVVRPQAVSSGRYTLSSADEASLNSFWGLLARGSGIGYACYFKDTTDGVDNRFESSTDEFATGEAAIYGFISDGTTYSIRLNGFSQTLNFSKGSNTGDWFGDAYSVDGRDNLLIGALERSSGPAVWHAVEIAEIIVYDNDDLTSAEKSDVEAMLSNRYNIDVASLTITSPTDKQVFQRNGTSYDLSISGSYQGSPSAIEADLDGQGFATIDASPSGNTYSGTLTVTAPVQGILTVRFSDQSQSKTITIAVTDVFCGIGQSNVAGRGTNNQIYIGSGQVHTYTDEDQWELKVNDPVESDGNSAGSPWMLFSNIYYANFGAPPAFVFAAEGGTGLVAPDEDWTKGNVKYTYMASQLTNAGITAPALFLFHQGEKEMTNDSDPDTYKTNFKAMADDLQADYGIKVCYAQIGDHNSASEDTMNNIRFAQVDAESENANILPGPLSYDQNFSDSLHWKTDLELNTLAKRWWVAVEEALFGGSNARGPRLSSTAINGANDEITLTFDKDLDTNDTTYTTSAFVVKDNGTPVTVDSVTRSGTRTVLISLNAATSGTVTVSMGAGTTGNGATLPKGQEIALPGTVVSSSSSGGDDVVQLPAESFLDESISSAGQGLVPLTPFF